MKKILIVLLIIVFISVPSVASASDGTGFAYDGYSYDFWGNVLESPAAFLLERVIDETSMEGLTIQGMNDVCTSEDGRIFLIDTLESRLNIVNQNGVFIKSIKAIKDSNNKIVIIEENGQQMILNAPEGVFYYEKNDEIYIADTGAGRVIVLDGTTYAMKRVINKPKDMAGVSEYKPSKIAVDDAGRIYIVVQSSYEGIIELNPDGTFSRYYGVNSPSVNLFDYFWKSISTDEQKEKMKKTFAPAFNNITIDNESFVYAVSYDGAAEHSVFRMNTSGENVLREEGNYSVVGDIHSMDETDYSRFVDIAVTDYGTYAVIDKTKGRIFLYDYDGQLLNVFGSIGNTTGSFRIPTGIAWLCNKLVVTDSQLKCAYILKPTDFGEALLKASEEYYNGNWDEAQVQFEKIVNMNANYEVAYIGIGKNYLMKDEYKKAMYYFKLGNNREFYSKAFNGYRGEVLKEHFGIVAAIFLLLIVLIIASEVRYHTKGEKRRENRALQNKVN